MMMMILVDSLRDRKHEAKHYEMKIDGECWGVKTFT